MRYLLYRQSRAKEMRPDVEAKPLYALIDRDGSGDFAQEVRRILLTERFDCIAVPLPPSFQTSVETAIPLLPTPTMVVQAEPPDSQTW